MKNHGTLLRQIRQEKGLSQKDIYEGIMSRQAYHLIESNQSMPSFDKFLLILEKLFLTVEEFLYMIDSERFLPENHLYRKLSNAVLKKDKECLQLLIQMTEQYYQATNNEKYHHFLLISKAMLSIIFGENQTNESFSIKQMMLPIKNYLLGIDDWHSYELKLLNNSLYCFNLSEAIALGLLVTKKINRMEDIGEYQDIKLRIYLNLSTLCLRQKDYSKAIFFSELAIKNAHKDYRIFEILIARLNNAIAQSVKSSKKMTTEIDQCFNILNTLDYCKIVEDYKNILSSN